MKNKWLIGALSCVMATAFCVGLAACNNDDEKKTGPSDEEIAQSGITMLNGIYLDSEGKVKDYETPEDYLILSQTKVGDDFYAVNWSVTSETENIGQYVKIGTEADASARYTVDITRATFDIEYTLTASITVGKVTKTADYGHKIPKKSSEDSITASLDLSAAANRTTLDTDNNEQVWQQNGVTLTNTGNLADFIPIRLYKNTTVKIEMENAKIIHIDFHSAQGYDDSPYPEYLKTSIESSDLPIKGEVAVSEDGLTISVDFETPLDVVTFKTTAGQCRLTSIDVEAIERDPDEHVHNWTYQHVEGTWTHTATCTAEGCDVNTKTEACTPKLNVCECGYTYSAKEIVDALFALEENGSLPGTYSLTGVVTAITDAYSTQYKNVTFEMTVEGKTVTAFRVKGTYATEVEVGGTATVTGELLDYGGKKEFTAGGSVVAFVPGVDERTPQQKVTDALSDLSDTFTVTKAGETELPASTEKDVTFTWATEDKTYTITDNKINVDALPAEDVTVTATVTATCGTEAVTNNTKTVTITIKAKGEEPTPGSGDGTVDHPYSVAEATEIIAGLGTETVYKVNGEIALVYVKGIVTVKGTTDSYGIKNYFMADVAGDTENDISVYSLNWGTVKQGTEINVGDTIIVTGYLQNFNGTYEVSSYKDTSWHNGTVEAHTPVGGTVTPPTPSEEVKLPDGDVKLDFSSVTEKGTEITSGDATDYFKGFTESADFTAATVTEKVYKGNGTGGGDYENAGGMLKLGTSKVGATITLTFAKNVTKVVIMAQGWPGKSDTLAVNDGTAQTMSGSEKALYTFELTAPAKEIKITSNVRAFIFGIVVTFEGGTTTPKTDAEKLADAKTALKLSKTSLDAVGAEVELPATQGEASVTYELQGTTDLVKIEGGKLTVLKLPETDTEIVIKATLTVGQETDNVDLKVTILAPEPFSPITAPAAGSDYYMGMKAQDGEYHYLTGAMTGYYMATTTDIESAKKVTLAGSNDAGWTMVLDGKYIEIELSGTHVNAVYKTSQTAGSVWKWDSQYNIFTMEISGSKYFLGTNGSYTTVGGGDYSKYVASNWLAVLGTYGKGGTVDPTPDPDPEPDPDVHDDEKYGSAAAPLSVEEALALAAEECTSLSSWTKQIVYMTGKITAIGDRKQGSNNSEYYPNVYLQDLTNSQKVILVYSLNLSTKETILGQNDTVVMSGYITLFGYSEPGTIEFSGKDDVHPTVLNCTRGESEISTEVTGATISGLPSTNKAVNGTEISFTIQADAGKKIASVKAYDKEIEATEGTYKFTLNGNVTIKVETIGENEKAAEEIASLGFADATAKAGDTSVGSYTSEWEATRGSYTWVINNFNNNRNGWNFIKTGHKTSAVVGTITTKAALAAKISKVIVTIDSTSKNYMADNVNSFKLQIADTNEFTNPTEISLNIKTGENEFVIDTPAANKFYRIVIDCKTNVSDNGFVVLSSVSYWGTTD